MRLEFREFARKAAAIAVALVLALSCTQFAVAADDAKSGDKKDKKTTKLAVIEVSGGLAEGPEQDGLFGEASVGLNKLLERIDEAKNDAKIGGLVLQIRD